MQTAKRRARGSRVPLGGAVRARPVRGGKRAPHFPLRTARGQMKSGGGGVHPSFSADYGRPVGKAP